MDLQAYRDHEIRGSRPNRQALGLEVRANRLVLSYARKRYGRPCEFETRTVNISSSDVLQHVGEVLTILQEEGWTNLPCVVAIHGEATIMRSRQFDGHHAREIADYIDGEIERFTRRSPYEMVAGYDYTISLPAPTGIVFAITRRDTTMLATTLPRALGLQISAMVPGPVALYNGVHTELPDKGPPVVVLDIGSRVTEVIIANRCRVFFARSVTAIFPGDTEANDASAWLAELSACMELYLSDSRNEDRIPQQAMLCGIGADATVLNLVGDAFKLTVELLSARKKNPLHGRKLDYPVATGLAVGGINEAPLNVNLLPRGLREANLLKGRLFYWKLACLIVVICMLGIYNLLNWAAARKELALSEKQGQLDAVVATLAAADDAEAASQRYQRQAAPVWAALQNGAVMRRLISALGDAKHPDDWITRVADVHSYELPDVVSEGESVSSRRDSKRGALDAGLNLRTVIVEGYTPIEDFSTIHSMIETLRNKNGVVSADLLGDDRLRLDVERDLRWDRFKGRLFAVEIELEGS